MKLIDDFRDGYVHMHSFFWLLPERLYPDD